MRTRKKRARKKSRTNIIIAVSVVLVIILIAISIIKTPTWEKEPADVYFKVLWSTVDDIDPDSPSPTDRAILLIRGITFNLSASKGDAHDVVVADLAGSSDQYIEYLAKGEYAQVSMQFSTSYRSVWSEQYQGFSMKIRVRSLEATGDITFYIPLE